MKILTISSSTSRGRNSDTMLDHFIKGIKTVDGAQVEKVYLDEIPMDLYKYENRNGPQENEEEFKKLTNKIKDEITALVISTPTYNFSVPAHLKNFIDRIRFISLDFSKKNKLNQPEGKLSKLYVYFLVSGGTPNWAQKILFFAFPPFWLRGVFLYFGAKVMGAFYSGDIETFKNKKILEKCSRLGNRFAIKVKKGKQKGILERVFLRPPEME